MKLKFSSLLFFIFIVLTPLRVNAGQMILNANDQQLKAFYTQKDKTGWDVNLKGKVISLGNRNFSDEGDIAKKIQNNTRASVRLYNNYRIKIGDELYIINRNNLIISKMKITSIFKSKTFGHLMVGIGNLRLANIGDRVVQKINFNILKDVTTFKNRGDYYQELGEIGKAINFYKSALETDSGNPEAHLALGYIYLNDNNLQFAFNEFKEARKQIERLYDNEDKYLLLKGMTEVRFKEAYYKTLPNQLRKKYIDEGIQYSIEALKIYPDSKEVNYYLGMFYYKNSDPQDVKAKYQFLKVIGLDQNNIKSYTSLAELYDKHKNKEKAIQYAKLALKIDPTNDSAKFIINKSQ